MIVVVLVNCYLLFYAVMGSALLLRGLGLWKEAQSPALRQATQHKSRRKEVRAAR